MVHRATRRLAAMAAAVAGALCGGAAAANASIEGGAAELLQVMEREVRDFADMRNAPDATYALLGRALEAVGDDDAMSTAGADYAELLGLHEAAAKHVEMFGHPSEGNREGRRLLETLGEGGRLLKEGAHDLGAHLAEGARELGEHAKRLGEHVMDAYHEHKVFTDTPITSRTRLGDVDNPEHLRTLPWRLANKYQELLNKYCEPNAIEEGEKVKPSISGPTITLEVNFGGCLLETGEGSLKPTALRCDKGFISYTKAPGSLSGPYKSGTGYTGAFCPPLSVTLPKGKKDVVKEFGGETHVVWESKKLKEARSGLLGGILG